MPQKFKERFGNSIIIRTAFFEKDRNNIAFVKKVSKIHRSILRAIVRMKNKILRLISLVKSQ